MICASNNQGKINEIKKILNNYDVKSLKDINLNIDILEDGETYFDNALKKAKTIYEITKIPTLADDSGLEIHALNNWPGVKTKRLSLNDEQRNELLISKTKNKIDKKIKAVCVLVYYDGKKIISSEGYLNGEITDRIYEGNGFGFDSIFKLSSGKIVSLLTNEEKNKISARRIALENLKEKLNNEVNNA